MQNKTKSSFFQMIAAAFLRLISVMPRKKIKTNQALSRLQYNKSFSTINSGYITDQRICDRMRIGESDMGYAGCEIIAIYNAARLLNKDVKLSKLIFFAETNGLLVRLGKWGTNPYRLADFSNVCDINLRRCDRKKIKTIPSIYVISFWNSKNIWDGIHTVCLQIQNDKIISYNLIYSAKPKVHKTYDLKALFSGKPIVSIYRVS